MGCFGRLNIEREAQQQKSNCRVIVVAFIVEFMVRSCDQRDLCLSTSTINHLGHGHSGPNERRVSPPNVSRNPGVIGPNQAFFQYYPFLTLGGQLRLVARATCPLIGAQKSVFHISSMNWSDGTPRPYALWSIPVGRPLYAPRPTCSVR